MCTEPIAAYLSDAIRVEACVLVRLPLLVVLESNGTIGEDDW